MKRFLPTLYALAGVVIVLLPVVVVAQGLVPCGGIDCNLCDLGTLMQKVINFLLFGFAIPLAAAMFAYAGLLYVTGGSNPGRITRAHKIFKNVLIGFLIAISSWLVVQTILSTVFDGDFWIGGNWNELQCVSRITNIPDGSGRLIGTSVNDLIKQIVPQVKPPAYNVNYVCPSGFTLTDDKSTCFSPGRDGVTVDPQLAVTPVTGEISTGVCSPTSIFGSNANLMSCICGAESAGRISTPSLTDVMSDRRAFSWGLYQINLTANEIRCPGQAPLNCPSAFDGKNYNARVVNESLYQACVSAAKNQSCNENTAVYLLNQTPNGARNWSTYGTCVGQ